LGLIIVGEHLTPPTGRGLILIAASVATTRTG
jgi:hypothetical protein